MLPLFFLLLLPVFSLAKPQAPVEISTSQSPLDDDDETSTMAPLELPFNVRVSNLMPRDCSQSCNKKLMSSLKHALGSNSDMMSGYADICSEYAETLQCLDDWRHCGSTLMFDALTSGIRYMCVDQKDAFEANLACVNEAIGEVNRDCNAQCHPESVVGGWTLKTILEKDIKLLRILDPHMATISMSESCRIAKCVLGCFKSKLNIRCNGAAGSLLTEVVLRPFASIREKSGIMSNMVALILPQQCVFLANSHELNKFRMDPKMEENLKMLYADRANQTPAPNDFDPKLIEVWSEFDEDLRPRLPRDVKSADSTPARQKAIPKFTHTLTPKTWNNFSYEFTPEVDA
uniref:CPG4 domain-containing protein n=1 Tax=Panagrellus redivivus TaxID=6233 RepID=A0A7E4V8A5_PANRE